jgi:hypothetical protein
MQTAHILGQAMLSYATAHDGKYPDGNSSTEVFQKMLDEGYINNPDVFYAPLFGKIKPIAGQKLQPENICWDITCCGDSSASDSLPLVFLTGYKVTYAPGGAAVPVIRPNPSFTLTWIAWWNDDSRATTPSGIAVFYKGNKAWFLNGSGSPDGSIVNFIPPDFNEKGKTYRQLTPDGPFP